MKYALGIPPTEQPANHYRLLGIPQYEADPRVIDNAADRQMNHVRTFQLSAHKDESQRLLNELSAARVCLLNVGRKREYDAALRARERQAEATRRAAAAKLTSAPQHRVNPTSQAGYQLAGDTAPAFDAAAWEAPMASAAPVYAPVSFGRRPFWKEPHWMAVIVAGVLALLGGVFVLGMILSRPATPPAETEYADNTPQPGTNGGSNSAADTNSDTAEQNNSAANDSTGGNKADAQGNALANTGDNSAGNNSASNDDGSNNDASNGGASNSLIDAESQIMELMQLAVAAFNFEEGTYTNQTEKNLLFRDIGPGVNGGYNIGTAVFEPSIAGQAPLYDGKFAVRLPSFRGHFYDSMKTSFTIAFWRKCSSRDLGYLIDIGFYPESPLNIQSAENGQIQVTCGGKNRFTTSESYWTNEWQHLAMVFDSKSVGLYVDGVRVELWTMPPTVLNNLLIGEAGSLVGTAAIPGRRPGKYFHGKIDELVFLKTAATDEDIQLLYRWGKAGNVLPEVPDEVRVIPAAGIGVSVVPAPPPPPPADPETEAKVVAMMETAITMINFEEGTFARIDPNDYLSELIFEDLGPRNVWGQSKEPLNDFVVGQAGHAFHLDGITSAITLPQLRPALYEYGKRGITMSFWMKCAPDQKTYSVFNAGVYPNACIHLRVASNKSLEITYGQNNLLRSPEGAITGEWQHIVVAFDHARFTLWINGERIKSAGTSSTVVLNEQSIGSATSILGHPAASNEQRFHGDLDEFVILPGIAQDADVQLFYEWGKAGRPFPAVKDVDPPAGR